MKRDSVDPSSQSGRRFLRWLFLALALIYSMLLAGCFDDIQQGDEGGGGDQVVPTTGLVAHYTFAGDANDLSGNGNNGTLQGGAEFTTDRDGITDSALLLDGIDDYVALPNEANFDLTEFTIYAIINVTDYTDRRAVLSKGTSTGFGNYTTFINEEALTSVAGKANYVHSTLSGNWSSLVTTTAVPTGSFIHIAVTLTSSQFKSYLNGVVDRTVLNPPAPVLNDNVVQIGAHTVFGFYFKGAIDEVLIYNDALSDTEISDLFNSF